MSIEFVGNTYEAEKILKPSRDITFYTDRVCVKNDNKFKLYLQQEPAAINTTIHEVPSRWQEFNVILTYNDEVLKQCPNARFFYFQTVTWLDPNEYMNLDLSQKKFLVSNLTGFKRMCKAHEFRHHIYLNQMKFPQQFVFFRSSASPVIPPVGQNPIIGNDLASKMILFREFQFSLIIENTRERHCYTEKLVDCLITKTIPIYYGCENVGDYFDTTGWILITSESVDEILEKCKVLTPDYYSKYIDVIEKNYKKALEGIDNYTRLNSILATVPGYKDS